MELYLDVYFTLINVLLARILSSRVSRSMLILKTRTRYSNNFISTKVL